MPLTSFVGRSEAVAALRRLLSASPSTTRLLSLVGPGGIGKTRLALETARSLASGNASHTEAIAFADGVWLADLASVEDASAVPAAVAAALDSGRGPSLPSIAALTWTVADRQLLLVLDNCEHLIDSCARLADALLRNCPKVVILATSREALAIPGEVVWPVAALSVADVPADAKPDDVLRSEAGRLFVERASAVRPDFSLTDDNAATVARLCQQLDGIPLALELAAARVNAFDVHTIVTRLADRFVLLKSGNRLASPRHQTLQALVQWSYDLLTVEEQRLFARLAVFAGGWDIEAVEAVGADDQPGATPTIELLAHLVDKSLVARTADRIGRTRYVLLETLRQFAVQPLAASGELPRSPGAARRVLPGQSSNGSSRRSKDHTKLSTCNTSSTTSTTCARRWTGVWPPTRLSRVYAAPGVSPSWPGCAATSKRSPDAWRHSWSSRPHAGAG